MVRVGSHQVHAKRERERERERYEALRKEMKKIHTRKNEENGS